MEQLSENNPPAADSPDQGSLDQGSLDQGPSDRRRLELETRVKTFRAGGPGGQHRNKVETAVRLTHLPTGLTVVVSDHRSQLRNREAAFDRLQTRLAERAKRPPKRHKTRPTLASKKRRIEQKKRRSQIKHLRRPV